MINFVSQMVDEILVEYNGLGTEGREAEKWKITSRPHRDAMALIKTGDDMHEVLFSDEDLRAFKNLGYAVCHNKLDSYGKKVYIHHNMRTFKKTKNK